jgi:hypothetical protein
LVDTRSNHVDAFSYIERPPVGSLCVERLLVGWFR